MMKSLINNNLGKKHLVEECQQIKIKPLVKLYKKGLRQVVANTEVNIADVDIRLITSETGNGGYRYWFACPLCTRRVGILYHHPLNQTIGCRICLNLDYRKRRYKGMIEALN